MAKIEITKTELVWPGKYNEDGTRREVPRVNLPFQVIETINESRALQDVKNAPQATLFDTYKGNEGATFEEGWRNKLIWGDNLLVMSSLLEKFAGRSTSSTSIHHLRLAQTFLLQHRSARRESKLKKSSLSLRKKHIAIRGAGASIPIL